MKRFDLRWQNGTSRGDGSAPDPGDLPNLRELVLAYAGALACVCLITAMIALVPAAQRIANISFVYLFAVIAAALRFGSGPAIVASLLAFLAFNWYFVAPHHTFTVENPAEWLSLLIFLVTAVVTGQLMASLRAAAREALGRECETKALADASWTIAKQISQAHAFRLILSHLCQVVGTSLAAIYVPDDGDRVRLVASIGSGGNATLENDATQQACAFVIRNAKALGWEGERLQGTMKLDIEPHDGAYLPLVVEQQVLGVLYIRITRPQPLPVAMRRVVESLANVAAVILERDRITRAETRVQVLAEADRLKTALLSMVSHDFRSPLASIKASVSSLLQDGQPMAPDTQREMLFGIEQETDRLNRMVGDILALSRLEADAWRPNREPSSPVEIVGAALTPFGSEANRRIRAVVPHDQPDVWLDPVQMVQVLHNLVDNALKYGAPDQPTEIRAAVANNHFVVEVADRGPGLLPGEEEKVFERFYRSPRWQESAVPGMGIGLAVCRGLVEAHGGRLSAKQRAGGGAVFRLELPTDVIAEDKELPAWT